MPNFNNVESLLKYIERKTEDVLRTDISNYSEDVLTNRKQIDVYNSRESVFYNRTYEFLNSSKSTFDEKASSSYTKVISVFSDTSKSSMPSGHPSWVDNSNQNEFIPLWLNSGNNNSSLYSYVGTNYFSNFVSEVKSNLKTEMIKGLKKRNIYAY